MDRPDDDRIVYEQDAFLARLDAEQDRVPAGGLNGGEFAGSGASSDRNGTAAVPTKKPVTKCTHCGRGVDRYQHSRTTRRHTDPRTGIKCIGTACAYPTGGEE